GLLKRVVSGRDARLRGTDKLPRSVLDHADADAAIGRGEAEFDVADRAGGALHLFHHVLAAIGAGPDVPSPSGSLANLAAPLRAGFREKIAEDVIGALSFRTVDYRNIEMRQRLSGIDFFDFGVVPGLDVSEKNFCEERPREVQAFYAGNMVDRHNGDE